MAVQKTLGHDYETDVRCPVCSLRHRQVSELIACMRGHGIPDDRLVERLTAVGLLNPGENLDTYSANGLTQVPK